MQRSLNQLVERWIRTPPWKGLTTVGHAKRFIKNMEADGYKIASEPDYNEQLSKAYTDGLAKGVRMASIALLRETAPRQTVASLLYGSGAYEALNLYRKSKKLGWSALGFTPGEVDEINRNLALLSEQSK